MRLNAGRRIAKYLISAMNFIRDLGSFFQCKKLNKNNTKRPKLSMQPTTLKLRLLSQALAVKKEES
jgi:hypothetical protein